MELATIRRWVRKITQAGRSIEEPLRVDLGAGSFRTVDVDRLSQLILESLESGISATHRQRRRKQALGILQTGVQRAGTLRKRTDQGKGGGGDVEVG